jgi:thioredoxin 1
MPSNFVDSLKFKPMNAFEQHISGDKPVVVDFFAEWCGPCKMMPPILKQVKETVGDKVTILKMDVDKNQEYAQRWGIQSIPTLMIFQKGEIIWRKAGVTQAKGDFGEVEGGGGVRDPILIFDMVSLFSALMKLK